jgi:C1A family cysteine protease
LGNTLPNQFDIRNYDSDVDNQWELGSCSANALVNAYENLTKQEKPTEFVDLSRLFVYYNTRVLHGNVKEDNGAYLRDAIKAVETYGVCAESYWPYRISYFDDEPNESAYADAKKRNLKNYKRIINIQSALDAVYNKKPVIFGLEIFGDFLDLTTDTATLVFPNANDLSLGGHAMTLVAYDIPKQQFTAKNSFGKYWGDNGYCYIPFEYLNKYGYDMWVFDIELT